VKLAIYDVTGRQVVELANETFGLGEHAVMWNGKDAGGRDVSSGTYMIYMESEDAIRSDKMTLVR
jgi:flagellar hook assembly protein FlgD